MSKRDKLRSRYFLFMIFYALYFVVGLIWAVCDIIGEMSIAGVGIMNGNGWDYLKGLLISLVVFLIIGYFIMRETKEEKIEMKKVAERKNQNDERVEREKWAKKIYEACKVRNITSFTKNENREALKVIAKNLGFAEVEKAEEYFELGKQLEKKEKDMHYWGSVEKEWELEKSFYEKALNISNLVGKTKYLTPLIKKYDEYAKSINDLKRLYEDANEKMTYKAKQKGWGAAGGMASAIGGPALALATVASVEAQNIQAKENEASTREAGRSMKEFIDKVLPGIINNYNWYKKHIEQVQSKICNEDSIDDKFQLIKISNVTCKVTKGHNLSISGNIDVNMNKVKVINRPAILDGSLTVKMYDVNMKQVGIGHINAPGEYLGEIKELGFANLKKFEIICYVENYKAIKEGEKYIYKIEPKHLWFMEI